MLFRKLSELGNPGMVARWAAEMYQKIKREKPEVSDYVVIDLMLWTRFNAIQPSEEQYIASIRARSTIFNIVDAVEFILDQEVDYFKNTSEKIQIMNEVIGDILCRNGVPHHMVFGNIQKTPAAPPAPSGHGVDCPYCQQTLRIPAITEKTEFRCPSCKRAFNVKP